MSNAVRTRTTRWSASCPDNLLDHLIGAGEHRGWYGKIKRPGRLEIDREIELGRLLDRQIGRLLALEDFAHIFAHSPVNGRKVGAIADETTRRGKSAGKIDRGNLALRRLRDELQALITQEWVWTADDCVGTPLLFDHLVGSGQQRLRHREAERARRLQVDRQFVPGVLVKRNIAGIGAAQDGVDVLRRPFA